MKKIKRKVAVTSAQARRHRLIEKEVNFKLEKYNLFEPGGHEEKRPLRNKRQTN